MWKCSCGLINNGLTSSCAGRNQSIINYSKHEPITENLYDKLTYYIDSQRIKSLTSAIFNANFTTNGIITMNEQEELFSKFYNHEKILVKDMDSVTLRAHEEELAKIAYEAKARLTALVDEKMQRNAKLSQSQKEWLVPTSAAENLLVSDAITAVNNRKQRLNKAERLSKQLKELGLDDETRKLMMTNIEKSATERQMNLATFVDKKVEERKKEEAIVEAEVKIESKPFDLSSLSSILKK